MLIPSGILEKLRRIRVPPSVPGKTARRLAVAVSKPPPRPMIGTLPGSMTLRGKTLKSNWVKPKAKERSVIVAPFGMPGGQVTCTVAPATPRLPVVTRRDGARQKSCAAAGAASIAARATSRDRRMPANGGRRRRGGKLISNPPSETHDEAGADHRLVEIEDLDVRIVAAVVEPGIDREIVGDRPAEIELDGVDRVAPAIGEGGVRPRVEIAVLRMDEGPCRLGADLPRQLRHRAEGEARRDVREIPPRGVVERNEQAAARLHLQGRQVEIGEAGERMRDVVAA